MRYEDKIAALKAFRRNSREAEIATFGKPVNHGAVFRNRKRYTRKEKHKKGGGDIDFSAFLFIFY